VIVRTQETAVLNEDIIKGKSSPRAEKKLPKNTKVLRQTKIPLSKKTLRKGKKFLPPRTVSSE
jgi:hypothetical protein